MRRFSTFWEANKRLGGGLYDETGKTGQNVDGKTEQELDARTGRRAGDVVAQRPGKSHETDGQELEILPGTLGKN